MELDEDDILYFDERLKRCVVEKEFSPAECFVLAKASVSPELATGRKSYVHIFCEFNLGQGSNN